MPALLTALPEATAITLTWRLLGNGRAQRYDDIPVLHRITRCLPEVIHSLWRAVMFKPDNGRLLMCDRKQLVPVHEARNLIK